MTPNDDSSLVGDSHLTLITHPTSHVIMFDTPSLACHDLKYLTRVSQQAKVMRFNASKVVTKSIEQEVLSDMEEEDI